MQDGCFTAMITPFTPEGDLDQNGLEQLIDFQIDQGITGILATGTTGESPTFKWKEHDLVVALTARQTRGKCLCIAGTGSNNTEEAIVGTGHAVLEGVDGILLVDPYYNGPSSLEIRREYYEVLAKTYPDTPFIPYIIPGRSGAQMLPQDLAILARDFKNVTSVKEATGNLDNMKLTRKLCGEDFKIMSGDDGLVFDIMTNPEIKAAGSISTMSNIMPGAMTRLTTLIHQDKVDEARALQDAMKPLLDLVVVTTQEESDFGAVSCRARNPLPLKTMMQILGMPCGPCRRPLGKMTSKGLQVVLSAMQQVNRDNPELLAPIGSFFGLDIEERLNTPKYLEGLSYAY